MKTTTNQASIEKTLHQRLKFLGYILLSFAILALVWDFIPAVENELDELILEIEETPPPLNSYLVASTFALVGSSCLFIYWKKKATFIDT